MKKKAWLILACALLIIGASVFGTLAYLTHSTTEVKNTFTVGKLLKDGDEFVLKEHKATDDNKDGVYTLGTEEVTTNEYTVLPGVALPKDPFVKTSEALELDAYVFVEVVDGTSSALTVTVDTDKWAEVTGATPIHTNGKVYVMKANNGIAEAGNTLSAVSILKDNKITVANEEITNPGEVTFYGYMIQAAGFNSASAAWAGYVADHPTT